MLLFVVVAAAAGIERVVAFAAVVADFALQIGTWYEVLRRIINIAQKYCFTSASIVRPFIDGESGPDPFSVAAAVAAALAFFFLLFFSSG